MPNPENIEQHKFQPGESGNPSGRPKGSRNRSTLVREWLEVKQKEKNPLTGQVEELEQQDLITLALIKKAKKCDVQAYKELMDSAHGKIEQKTDITSKGQKLFQVNILDGDH